MKLKKITYSDLNPKAKEMYNFQKVSSRLADYGFTTMWLNNDWKGADFIAVHLDGVTDIKIQLKTRITIDKKYIGKDIYICFIHENDAYLYPHDKILKQIEHRISDEKYKKKGVWSDSNLTKKNKKLLKDYLL